jgi:hypothetical protein
MTRWHSAHVHLHDSRGMDRLILDAVEPLFARLPAGVEGAYFARHWVRGPHLRLQIRAGDETYERAVKPLIEEVVGGHLARHPSAGHPHRAVEEKAHVRLAELEREAGPLLPWHADNTIRYEPYDQRLHVLGTVEAAEQLAAFHAATTPLAFEVLRRVDGGAQRLDLLISLMMATAYTVCPPLTRGYISYRSHAEGFFANAADGAGMRRRFDAVYAANSAGLDTRLTEVVSSVDSGGDDVPLVREWVAVVREFKERAEQLESEGTLPLPSPLPAAARGEAPPDDAWRGISDFHQALYGNADVVEQLDASWFTVYRVLLNYQYLFFSRVGVTPVERFMLCHLTATTVENRYDLALPRLIGYLRQGVSAP